MQFLRNLFGSRRDQGSQKEWLTGEELRANIRKLNSEWLVGKKKILIDCLNADPPAHPGDLFYTLRKLSQYALELGMLDWRERKDPTHYLNEIRNSFVGALEVRPDILPSDQNPSFMAIFSIMKGWDLPFNTDPPKEGDLKFAMEWMDRWMIAGLADPSCWAMKAKAPETKNRFINQCLDDYWSLLTDQIDPEEGMRRCIKNYDRRATHQTFKAMSSYMGGGEYNKFYVDYTLAAILKKRGLISNSIHDWAWD